jgi:hypothetical protein
MPFTVKDLMIQVLAQDAWYAMPCSGGTLQQPCGQCTSVSGDAGRTGEDEEEDPSTESTKKDKDKDKDKSSQYALAALEEQLRQALARQPHV